MEKTDKMMENNYSISFYMNGIYLAKANFITGDMNIDKETRYSAARAMYITKYDRFIIYNNDKISVDSDKLVLIKWFKIFGLKIFKRNVIKDEITNYYFK